MIKPPVRSCIGGFLLSGDILRNDFRVDSYSRKHAGISFTPFDLQRAEEGPV